MIDVPRVYLTLGQVLPNGNYPIYYCEAGDNSGSVRAAIVEPDCYEVMSAACELYNSQRNLAIVSDDPNDDEPRKP